MPGQMFRTLNETEKTEFRQWAKENYVIGEPVNVVWHPEVRAECERMNAEALSLKLIDP